MTDDLHATIRSELERGLRRYTFALTVLNEHAIIHRNIGWLEFDDGEYVENSAEIPVCGLCVPKHSHFRTRAGVPEGTCAMVRALATFLGLGAAS